MKRTDLAIMMSVAVSTATLTVASFWAGPLEAGGEAETLTPKIAKPKFVTKGVELTLTMPAGTAQPGDEPVFELAAVNTSGDPVNLNVHLAMTAMSPADALSRMVRMPNPLWNCDQSIALQPHEQKSISVATRTKLPAKNLISVTLSEALPADPLQSAPGPQQPIGSRLNARPSITLLNFATGPTAPTLALASPSN